MTLLYSSIWRRHEWTLIRIDVIDILVWHLTVGRRTASRGGISENHLVKNMYICALWINHKSTCSASLKKMFKMKLKFVYTIWDINVWGSSHSIQRGVNYIKNSTKIILKIQTVIFYLFIFKMRSYLTCNWSLVEFYLLLQWHIKHTTGLRTIYKRTTHIQPCY